MLQVGHAEADRGAHHGAGDGVGRVVAIGCDAQVAAHRREGHTGDPHGGRHAVVPHGGERARRRRERERERGVTGEEGQVVVARVELCAVRWTARVHVRALAGHDELGHLVDVDGYRGGLRNDQEIGGELVEPVIVRRDGRADRDAGARREAEAEDGAERVRRLGVVPAQRISHRGVEAVQRAIARSVAIAPPARHRELRLQELEGRPDRDAADRDAEIER